MDKLIVISIGPVQDFIVQARKTRDLWFGSYLLSELSRAAAKHFRDVEGGTLIFPYLSRRETEDGFQGEQDNKLPMPNKLIGLTNNGDPARIAQRVLEAVRLCWKRYTQAAQHQLTPYINEAMWKRQVTDFIEYYAAWAELPDYSLYRNKLNRVNELLTGRKTLRDFRQNEPSRMYGELKSSLNPGLESVLLERRSLEYARFGIKESETLDAISLVKRLGPLIEAEINTERMGQQPRQFQSVCNLAFIPYRKRLEANVELREKAMIFYREMLEKSEESNLDLKNHGEQFARDDISRIDSRLFYEQQMGDWVEEYWKPLESRGSEPSVRDKEGKKQLAQQMREAISVFVKQAGLSPSPYYAFLLCDGDRIGDRLKAVADMGRHRKWSELLSEFARESEEIIKSHSGLPIYSGGDDCMALLPLDTCLAATNKLRQRFAEIMEKAPVEEAKKMAETAQVGMVEVEKTTATEKKGPLTLSAGLVIAHMLEPLGEVRQVAMATERQAKRDRNRLAVRVYRRSGDDRLQLSVSWDENPVPWLHSLGNLYEQGRISVQLGHDLRMLYRRYDQIALPTLPENACDEAKAAWREANDVEDKRNRELLPKEIERILRRKRLDGVKLPNFAYDQEKGQGQAEDGEIFMYRTGPMKDRLLKDAMGEMIRTGGKSALDRLNVLSEQLMLAITLKKLEVDG